MKPKLLKISLTPHQSFGARLDSVPYFFNEWHFHPEIELVSIHNGTGTEFIGNSVQHFKPGDMILVGSGLPHLWRCDEKYFRSKSRLKAESIVIHFLPELFGTEFLQLPENKHINTLFEKAKQGLKIVKKTKADVREKMQQLLHATGTARIILLLEIIYILSVSKDLKPVSSKDFELSFKQNESERMNIILQYIMKHFSKKISLKEVSSLVHLNPESFCRYFKTRTKKTFSDFLLEVKINHACKLLIETDKPISRICFESGFNNFSNFNRYFKKKTKKNPLDYRKSYLQT